jgi:membrane-bound lytic murein transglycosylase D
MPQDLKFLAIVESALIPKAVSPVGAGGLWQFMAETGRSYGLTINREVDERSCAHSSTDAAMQYLARQYERYGSWEMALAAYNCGAGNINRAVKRARSNDYWVVSRYLPRETRNFVPAFIGAAYIASMYHLHEIEPEMPSLDMQLTEAITVFDRLEFDTIAALTALPLEVIVELNQAFKKNYVPESTEGFKVVLPRRVLPALSEYLGLLRPDNGAAVEMPQLPPLVDSASYRPEDYYFQSVYVVAEGDKLDELATFFKCSPYNLKVWNHLASGHLTKGQELIVWFPNEIRHFLSQPEKIEVKKPAPEKPRKKLVAPKKIPPLKTEVKSIEAPSIPPAPTYGQDGLGFQFYQLRRNENLEDVAQKFNGVSVRDLMKWNGFSRNSKPAPGTKLVVKTK